MPKTNIEKIEGIQAQIQQLENQRKQLIQRQKVDERKARTKRLIERGAILESLISDADAFTNEQIKSFLVKTVQSDYARKILDGVAKQGDSSTTSKPDPVLRGTQGASPVNPQQGAVTE